MASMNHGKHTYLMIGMVDPRGLPAGRPGT